MMTGDHREQQYQQRPYTEDDGAPNPGLAEVNDSRMEGPRDHVIALDVEGMMCQKNCGSTVRKALESVPGASRAEVSFAARRAWVWISSPSAAALTSSQVSSANENAVEAIEDVGFGAEISPQVELLVEGMMCQKNCGTTAKNALESVAGVAEATVSFAEGRARVWTSLGGAQGSGESRAGEDPVIVDIVGLDSTDLVDALECVGFDASIAPSAVLEVEGMMCQKNCGTTAQNALLAVSGVVKAEVSFAERRARVWARDGPLLPISLLVDAIEAVGFGARILSVSEAAESAEDVSGGASANTDGAAHTAGRRDRIDDGKADTPVSEAPLGLVADVSKGGDDGGSKAMAVGVFSVSGMSCASCVGNVEKFVALREGVEDVRVALLAEKAEVRFDPEVTNGQALADGITGLGYPARHLSTVVSGGAGGGNGNSNGGASSLSLEVMGVAGPGGVAKIENAVLSLPGVSSCEVTRQPFDSSGHGVGPATLPPAATSTFATAAVAGIDVDSPYGISKYLLTVSLATSPRSNIANGDSSSAGTESKGSGSDRHYVRSVERNTANSGNGEASSEILGGGKVHPDDAVWDALSDAYDAKGIRKVAGVRDVLEAVRGLGFGVRIWGGGGSDAGAMEASQAAEVAEWRRLLTISISFTLPVMAWHLANHAESGHAHDYEGGFCGGQASYGTLVSWVLVTMVQLIVGKRFYRNAYKTAKHGSFGMDMLVVVGTSVSYMYSSLALLLACAFPGDGTNHPHLFLESPAMLLMFISLGKFLEVLAKRKTSQALVFLLKAQPHLAVLVEPGAVPTPAPPAQAVPLDSERVGSEATAAVDGDSTGGVSMSVARDRRWQERGIEASLVQVGDVLRVLPGAQFPTDGIVLSGCTYVDESMITGESNPVAKGKGDHVCGGTANQHGSVLMRAERIGEDTMLAQLCRLVEEAQMSKAPIQRQADRVAGVFVPAVMGASLITFVGWFLAAEAGIVPEEWLAEERSAPFLFALLFGVSVVVVACPCALGLATPTAVMVGTGVGAGNGVLIKGGAALEAAHRVNTVVFDKTGTLTKGKPFLTDVVPLASPALERLMAGSPVGAAAAALARGKLPSDAESTAMAAIAAAAASAAVLDIAAACESGSEHPVGRAMVDAAAVAERTYAAATAAAAVVGERIAGGGTARRPFERRDQAESGSECPSSEDSNSDSFGLFESATAGATKTKDVALASSSNGARKRRLSKTEPQPMGTVPENDAHAAPGSAVTDFVSEPGRGVACQHPLGRVCVGTRAWGETNGGRRKAVEGQGDATMTQADAVMRELEEAGKTAVMVTLDGEAVGVVAVADTDKEGSRRAVLALGHMGLDVWVVTGDNRRVAAALARRLGVSPDRVMSEVLPAQKARKIQELQHAGGYVAMVGDGVNDAPALASADVGIAVGAGTQVAMEAADMVLVSSDVCDVVAALHLGRKVFGRIKLNFVFAMLYNLCGVPIAAGALYPFLHVRLPPAVAGLSMALSSISVVLSSLALRFYRKPQIDSDGKLLEQSMASIGSELLSSCCCAGRSVLSRRFLLSRRFHVLSEDEHGNDLEMGDFSPLDLRKDSRFSSVPIGRKMSTVSTSTALSRRALGQRREEGFKAGPYALVRTHSRAASSSSSLGGSGPIVTGGFDEGSVENGGIGRGLGRRDSGSSGSGVDADEDDGEMELMGRFVNQV